MDLELDCLSNLLEIIMKSVANKKPYIFVLGNEKGGVGKTTCAMLLITVLLSYNYNVVSIDTDIRQGSLSNYIKNREIYNLEHPGEEVLMPNHFHINNINSSVTDKELFNQIFDKVGPLVDYFVIDTPGSSTTLSNIVHSFADTVITPINDSFIDLDVIAKINHKNFDLIEPSIYSQMLWQQKIERATRDRGSINWFVLTNRLGQLHSRNKADVYNTLNKLCKRIPFKIISGFSERVIFRELFLRGLTLVDLLDTFKKLGIKLNISHIAARSELRNFISDLGIKPKHNVSIGNRTCSINATST